MHLCTVAFLQTAGGLIAKKVNNVCIMQPIGHEKQAAECAKISL